MSIIQPLGNRVLVRVLMPEETTEGGLLVRPVSKNDSDKGIVEALGEGTLLDNGEYKPINLKVGDKVLFTPMTGTLIKTAKEDYRLMSARDILGRFVESESIDE